MIGTDAEAQLCREGLRHAVRVPDKMPYVVGDWFSAAAIMFARIADSRRAA